MYLFALFLVLYEFTAYSANDMIMPGMIQVVQFFNVPEYYVAKSLSFYILGNCAFILIAGFLSQNYGKRRIILLGNFLFLLFTVIIVFSHNIHEFMLWRFLQGTGLAIIAVGYSLIHEKFNDKDAIKLIALMANISLLAPLLGPAIGSVIMIFLSWQYVFVLTALIGFLTIIGLYRCTPKDDTKNLPFKFSEALKEYGLILKNKEFIQGVLCSGLIIMPLLIWISQAPNLILYKLQLDYTHYIIYQLISIGGLTVSSILMQFIVGKYRLYSVVKTGILFMLFGFLIVLLNSNNITVITLGLFFYALGMGLANGCICRLIMTIEGHLNSMLSSMLGFVQMVFFVIGITLMNELMSYYKFALWSFTLSVGLFGFAGLVLLIKYISSYRYREWVE